MRVLTKFFPLGCVAKDPIRDWLLFGRDQIAFYLYYYVSNFFSYLQRAWSTAIKFTRSVLSLIYVRRERFAASQEETVVEWTSISGS